MPSAGHRTMRHRKDESPIAARKRPSAHSAGSAARRLASTRPITSARFSHPSAAVRSLFSWRGWRSASASFCSARARHSAEVSMAFLGDPRRGEIKQKAGRESVQNRPHNKKKPRADETGSKLLASAVLTCRPRQIWGVLSALMKLPKSAGAGVEFSSGLSQCLCHLKKISAFCFGRGCPCPHVKRYSHSSKFVRTRHRELSAVQFRMRIFKTPPAQ